MSIMVLLEGLQHSIQESPAGLTLAELLNLHPQLARRTAQRFISQMIATGQIEFARVPALQFENWLIDPAQ